MTDYVQDRSSRCVSSNFNEKNENDIINRSLFNLFIAVSLWDILQSADRCLARYCIYLFRDLVISRYAL